MVEPSSTLSAAPVWAKLAALAVFLLLLLLVWIAPRGRVFQDAPDEAPWRDLRAWATVLIAVQIALYLMLG